MSQRLRNSTLTIQTSVDGSEECTVIDPEGALQNVVIIEATSNTEVSLAAAAEEVKSGSSPTEAGVTQPPAVLTAAAALGMNLTSTVENSTVAAAAAGEPTVATGDHEGSSEGSCSSGGSAGGEAPSNGGRAEGSRIVATNVEVLTTDGGGRGTRSKQQRVGLLLSESSQTSNRQHHHHSADPTDSGSAVAQTTVTAAHLKSQSANATPNLNEEGSRHAPNAATAADNTDEDQEENSKMIDASDFRMVDPGCTYPTLAAAAAANGRMTPPNHHHHQHPHHALHHSHAMASYVNTSYTTLTPLQPLPPISTISSMQDKFQTYSPSGNEAGGEASATPNNSEGGPPVSVSNFMQSNLSPYMSMSPPHYPPGSHAAATAAAAIAMSAHSPPHNEGGPAHHYPHNGGSSLLSKQEPLSPNSYYAEAQRPSPHHDMSPHSLDHSPTGGSNGGSNAMVPTSNYEALTTNNNPSLNGGMTSPHTISPVPHTSPLLHHREMSPPSPPTAHHGNNGASILAAAAASALGQHHHHNPHGMSMPSGTPTMVTLKSTPSSNNNNSGGGGGGEAEEINTKDLAQRISAELKRYSIPQAIFAQRVLCRSQGTLSDLLRNPKPWSKLKSGRETFRRMQKWLAEPEFQRMSALRLAGKIFIMCFYALMKYGVTLKIRIKKAQKSFWQNAMFA